MRKSKRRLLAAVLFLGLPFLAVHGTRSRLDPLRDTPKARQKGDPQAKVVIVEYSDFQCPKCASIQPTVQRMLEAYPGKVRFAFKYFPLKQIHRNAIAAAHAAECASRQDRFWPYHDRLFAAQKEWQHLADPTAAFVTYATELQLDSQRFKTCLEDSSTLLPVQLDVAEGDGQMVKSTPTFFIGDERLVGDVFASEADRIIRRKLRS